MAKRTEQMPKEKRSEIKRKRMEELMIARKKKVFDAASNCHHRKLTELLKDKTLKFDQDEIDEILFCFTKVDERKYYSRRQRPELLATFRIILDDGRFPDGEDGYRNSVRLLCTDEGQFTDILHVILTQKKCPSAVYESIYKSLPQMIGDEQEDMLRYIFNLDWFNINRYMGRYKNCRALHVAVRMSTRRRNPYINEYVEPMSYNPRLVKMILACPNIQPNLQDSVVYSENEQTVMTALDMADDYYNRLVHDIKNPSYQTYIFDAEEELKEAAQNVFLLLSRDDVDIHTIGDH